MKNPVYYFFFSSGMALLSMAINLMQEQMIAKAKWLASQMGKKDVDDRSAKKYQVNQKFKTIRQLLLCVTQILFSQIKKSKEGVVAVTPPDKDGNQHTLLLLKNADDETKKSDLEFP